MQKGFAPILILIGILVIMAVASGAYYFGKSQTPKPQIQNPVVVSPTPQPTIVPSSIPATSLAPTTKPTDSNKTTADKVLFYQLPAGWQTAKNQNQDFEVGFNPQTMRIYPTVSSNQVWIEIQRPQPLQGYATYTIVTLVPYDGGSRHNFIYKQLGYTTQTALSERTSYYNEVSYTYNNWSCLILFGLGFSAQGTTWGMCPVNSTQALFIQGPAQVETEEFIKTIKWLK